MSIKKVSVECITLTSLMNYLKISQEQSEEIYSRLVSQSRWGLFANDEEMVMVEATTLIIWMLQNGWQLELPNDDELVQLEGSFVAVQFTDRHFDIVEEEEQ